jgi:hypothetical protein
VRHIEIRRTVRSEHSPDRALSILREVARQAGWAVVRDEPDRVELWAEGALTALRSSSTAVATTAGADGSTVVTLALSASRIQVLPGSRLRAQAEALEEAMRDPGRVSAASVGRTPEQRAIGALTVALVAAAIALALAVSLPGAKTAQGQRVRLPAVALGSEVIYRMEIALAALYGGLLVLVPLYRGAVRGDLPIEISARGAKYEQVGATVSEIGDRIEKLEKRLNQTAIDFSLKAAETGNQSATEGDDRDEPSDEDHAESPADPA